MARTKKLSCLKSGDEVFVPAVIVSANGGQVLCKLQGVGDSGTWSLPGTALAWVSDDNADLTFELRRAESIHGKLTDDPVRAMVIAVEELGEASAEILGIERALRRGDEAEAAEKRRLAVIELIQAASVIEGMIENLRKDS